MRNLYVYQYLVIDAEGAVHEGLVTAESRRQIMEDIGGNFGDCQYIHATPHPELVPEIQYGQFTGRVRPRGRLEVYK